MNELKYMINDDKQVCKKSDGKPIPEDEPIFIFRAQDRKALPALVAYSVILDTLDQRRMVQRSIEAFRSFQEKNPEQMKEPDAEERY